jgi:hypothetical protein
MPFFSRDVQLPDQPHVTIRGTSVPAEPVELPASTRGLHAAASHGHADGLERAARLVERDLVRALERVGADEDALDQVRSLVGTLRSYAVQARDQGDYLVRRGGKLYPSDGYGGGIAPYQQVRLRVVR